MYKYLSKLAALLALIIGGSEIYAGGKVLLGSNPGYFVINWLPLYNYTVGILTVFITAILIWAGYKLAMPAAVGTFSFHAVVMLILQTAYSGVVAPDSIRAMTIRLVGWLIILALMLPQWRQKRKSAGESPTFAKEMPAS